MGSTPRLVRAFRVVTYDARGHGLSGKPEAGYGFDHVVSDALAVMQAAGVRRPLIVGHSWGAMTALELAAAYPREVSGAVLVDGGLAGPGRWWDWKTTKEQLSPPALKGMSQEKFLEDVRRWAPVPVTPKVEAMFLSLMHVDRGGRIRPRLSRANHLRILRAIWEQHPLELYGRLRIPTLAIAARTESRDETERRFMESKELAMTEARAAARGRPVRFAWMKGVHDLPVQHPAALASRIERFARGGVG